MLSVLLTGLLLQCPAYADLPQPREGLSAAYASAGNSGAALGLGERIERVGPRGVESVQFIIPPAGTPSPAAAYCRRWAACSFLKIARPGAAARCGRR